MTKVLEFLCVLLIPVQLFCQEVNPEDLSDDFDDFLLETKTYKLKPSRFHKGGSLRPFGTSSKGNSVSTKTFFGHGIYSELNKLKLEFEQFKQITELKIVNQLVNKNYLKIVGSHIEANIKKKYIDVLEQKVNYLMSLPLPVIVNDVCPPKTFLVDSKCLSFERNHNATFAGALLDCTARGGTLYEPNLNNPSLGKEIIEASIVPAIDDRLYYIGGIGSSMKHMPFSPIKRSWKFLSGRPISVDNECWNPDAMVPTYYVDNDDVILIEFSKSSWNIEPLKFRYATNSSDAKAATFLSFICQFEVPLKINTLQDWEIDEKKDD